MESLSSASTIIRIAKDIATAVETVNRNKSRCKKLQKRVQDISDVLLEAGRTNAATQRLLDRLQDALSRALRLVKLCKGRSCPINFIAGGRMADQFDELDGEIDRCLLDLGAANHIIIARLEKQLQNMAGSTETVTLRIGMPCDDSTEKIKHCISTMQGVTEVAAGAANKDQFMVTVRSGTVDIPRLMDQVKNKLNRNVELITPEATVKDATSVGMKKNVVKDQDKKANRNSEGVEDRSDRPPRHSSRYAADAEAKKEKAAANIAGVNQQAPAERFVYLPLKVELVPVGDASSMYPVPSLNGFVPQAYAAPGRVPVHVQQQSNLHRVHFKDAEVNKHDSVYYTKDTMMKEADKDEKKGEVAGNGGIDKEEKKEKVAGDGEWKDRDNTMAAGNVTAIGVPVHRATAGIQELVPPPWYGHGYWPYAADCHSIGGCCYHNSGGPSDVAAAHRYNHNSPYPDMFSDENPNACSI
ncbi:hypothetical protein EJB05_34910, partial [Eragrostis curvula]